ncbi:MAG: hypothetical protein CMIDDMOC_00553 [Sodalis sp. Fle]|nr:MAG: hypothetical protein CMIDDMOC_00553 [Sodalis sp. Fle]
MERIFHIRIHWFDKIWAGCHNHKIGYVTAKIGRHYINDDLALDYRPAAKCLIEDKITHKH